MIPQLNEVKSANIQRFEAAYTRQTQHDKVDVLRMRIGAGVAGVGALGFGAVLLTMGAGAIAVGLIFPVAIIAAFTAFVALTIILVLVANAKSNPPQFPLLLNMSIPTFDQAIMLDIETPRLYRYGLISEETFKELQDFERRFRAVPGAVKGNTPPEHDAAYKALNQEWREVLIPKIEADLPYSPKEREFTLKSWELHRQVKTQKITLKKV